MGRSDPFFAYSILLRTIILVLVPAFLVLQFFRLKRALHVFQLESYVAPNLLRWVKADRRRWLFLRSLSQKKPLAMTGRAWRLLAGSLFFCFVLVLVVPGIAHLTLGGWPADVAIWAVMTGACFVGAPHLLIAADRFMRPVQTLINGRFEAAARRKLANIDPLVIGVTGSFGKTSTKFAVQSLVGVAGDVLATPASYNTPLGVIRTINEQLEPGHKILVVEMGARRTGDVRELCELVGPEIAVLTSIGPAHVETFGSIEQIERAKYEIVDALSPTGTAVMNVDDPRVRELANKTTRVRVVRYGLDPVGEPEVTATGTETTQRGTNLTIVHGSEALRVGVRLLGRHALGHVLAAVAVAVTVGRDLVSLRDPIEGLAPVDHRLQIIHGDGGITVIDDAYNSNPEGAAAALEVLASMPARKRVVVTPGIVELGPLQKEANEELGERAARTADAVIVVAPENREALLAGAQRARTYARITAVDSLARAQTELASLLGPGDVVLFENDLPDHYET